jgi:hypothetical protein
MAARTLPTLPTFVAEQELTSSELNQIVAYQAFWANPPMFSMHQGTSQNITNASNTQITMDTSDFDTDSGRSAATPWSYVIPFAGRWQITVGVVYAGNTTGGRQAMIFQNGVDVTGAFDSDQTIAIGTVTDAAQVTRTFPCNVGDVIAAYTWQDSGGTLATNVSGAQCSFFEGRLVSLASP